MDITIAAAATVNIITIITITIMIQTVLIVTWHIIKIEKVLALNNFKVSNFKFDFLNSSKTIIAFAITAANGAT